MCSKNESRTTRFSGHDLTFPFLRMLIQGPNVCKRGVAAGYFGTGEIFYSVPKGPLAVGATCCTALGFPLTRLRGTCFARPIPNALAKIDSLVLIPGKLLIVPLFLLTLAAYLIDFAIVCTVETQTSETETEIHTVQCERSKVRFLNDPSRLN